MKHPDPYLVLRYLHEAREWLKMLLPPFLLGLHMKQPRWVGVVIGWFKKDSNQENKK